MQENYTALLKLPIVSKLIRKNARLERENKALKSLIYSLPEFRCQCRSSSVSSKRDVHIKTEKEDTIPVQCETLVDNDEVVMVSKPVGKINIVYEINEKEAEEEDMEDAALDGEEAASLGEEVEDEVEVEEEVEEEEDGAEEEKEDEAEEEEEEEEVEVDAAQLGEEVDVEDEAAPHGQEEEEEEEEEEEVFAITISGKSYYTTNKDNGKIYAIDAEEEIGDEIGEFKNGKAQFYTPMKI